MADYNVDLSPAQGAGTQPLAPVQQQPDNISMMPFIHGVAGVLNNEIQLSVKQQAKDAQSAVVQQYVKTQGSINDAVTSGQMNPAQAAARSRASNQMFFAQYPQYMEALTQAGRAMNEFTQTGQNKTVEETAAKDYEKDKDFARSRGFQFIPGMAPQAEADQIKAAFTAKKAEDALKQQHAANTEARAQGTFDQHIAEKKDKDQAISLINDIASDNLTAFNSFSITLRDNLKSGKMTAEDANFALTERFSAISGAMQAAARTNPELAGPYRTLFNDMNEVAKKMIDPKKQSEDLDRQLKDIQTRMALVAMNDPASAAVITANKLIPNNPSLSLGSAAQGARLLAILGNQDPAAGGLKTPQVIGTDQEKATLDLLKDGLKGLTSGKIPKSEDADRQAANSVNNLLKQTGELINRGGVGPTDLKKAADFFASPEYAGWVTSGKMDKQAANTAKQVFQLVYEPAIIQGVQQKFDQELFSPNATSKDFVAKRASETVDVKFTGTGVVFEPKAYKGGMMDIELRNQAQIVTQLKSAQAGINQLVHMGAHMEGSTNYAKYWEEHKHEFLPGYYMKGVEAGTVKNGYEFKGGDARSPANWAKAADGK